MKPINELNGFQMEWLGDALYRLFLREYILNRYSHLNQHELTRLECYFASNRFMDQYARKKKFKPLGTGKKRYARGFENKVYRRFKRNGLQQSRAMIWKWLDEWMSFAALEIEELLK